MLTVGSLFSGIGGLELGLERTGGFKTIWQCEFDDYAGAVLKKHWPQVPNYGDITKVDWTKVERPDLICGGFPCQDISTAGKGAGIEEGTRSGLWREFHKTIRILRPKYALVENVSALSFRGLCRVLGDLAEIGYNAEWFTLQAAEVGAPHKRERLFIIAYRDAEQGNLLLRRQSDAQRSVVTSDSNNARGSASASGVYGNGQAQEQDGGQFAQLELARHAKTADNGGKRVLWLVQKQVRRFAEFSWCENVREVKELFGRADIPEPLVRRGSNGLSNYVDRIKCLGNAVVPQVAQVIGEAILEIERGEKTK